MNLPEAATAPPSRAAQHPALRALQRHHLAADAVGRVGDHATASPFLQRYRFEAARLHAMPGITPAVAVILAARAAASQPAPGRTGRGDEAWPESRLAPFRAAMPDPAALVADLPAPAGQVSRLTTAEWACLRAAWPFALATEHLLASGGDDRLTLDPATGLNRYGCAPWPRPHVVGFASCTASSLSDEAFVAADQARRGLIANALVHGPQVALAQASERAAALILAHFDVADLAHAVLTASGTDAALVVTGLLAAEHDGAAMTSLLVSPAETGSGVPDAVQGRHFAGVAPTGHTVSKGGVLDGLSQAPRLATIALRDAAGTPFTAAELAASCTAAIEAALPGGRVVLHAIDGSKTGLAAPDRATLLRLAARFGASLDIVIDACQARIEPALVRWYLQQGFPVLVTGSKFFAAPGFCGAVLFPRARLSRIAANGRVPAGLAGYARLEAGVGSRLCPGLLLRWTAALHAMTAFRALTAGDAAARLDTLGAAIRNALRQDRRLRLVTAPQPPGMGWSDRRSVFTFAVRNEAGWMSAEQLRPVYQALQEDVSDRTPGHAGTQLAATLCQVGQPVQLGSHALGGLRLALSAEQVVQGGDQADALSCVTGKLRLLLDARQQPAEAWPVAEPALG